MLSANAFPIIKVMLLIHVTRIFRLTLLYRRFHTWWVQNISRDSADNEVRCVYYSVLHIHYNDAIMSDMPSQIISLTTVYSTVYSRCRSKKHQSSASLAFVRGIHRWAANSPHKGPVTRKMFPSDDVIMCPSLHRVAINLWQRLIGWRP